MGAYTVRGDIKPIIWYYHKMTRQQFQESRKSDIITIPVCFKLFERNIESRLDLRILVYL